MSDLKNALDSPDQSGEPALSRIAEGEQEDGPISHLAFAINLVASADLSVVKNNCENSNLSGILKLLIDQKVEQVSFLFNTDHTLDDASSHELRQALTGQFKDFEDELGSLPINFTLNYSARDDIVQAVRSMAEEGTSDKAASIEQRISDHLHFGTCSEPDLIIYFGGKKRIGKPAVWFGAYSEFVFETKRWEEFLVQDCRQVLDDYTCRERRFGALQEEKN